MCARNRKINADKVAIWNLPHFLTTECINFARVLRSPATQLRNPISKRARRKSKKLQLAGEKSCFERRKNTERDRPWRINRTVAAVAAAAAAKSTKKASARKKIIEKDGERRRVRVRRERERAREEGTAVEAHSPIKVNKRLTTHPANGKVRKQKRVLALFLFRFFSFSPRARHRS